MSTDLATVSASRPDLARPEDAGVDQVRAILGGLKAIRTFIAQEFKGGTDFGKIPGCGDKPTLLLPGAQKTVMYFNAYPSYRVTTIDLGGGHAEFQIRTILRSRSSAMVIGEGIGSASTKEKKMIKGRGGAGMPACPSCGKPLRKNKDENRPGYYCWKKEDGCGATFAIDHPKLKDAKPAEAPEQAVYDVRNNVLKMAKKRSLVDAALTLGCLGELFTQDIEDIYDLAAEPTPIEEFVQEGQRHGSAGIYSATNPHPRRTGYGHGEFLHPDQNAKCKAWLKECCDTINVNWADQWAPQMQSGMGLPNDATAELMSPFRLTGHLMKWIRDSDWIPRDQIRDDIKSDLAEKYISLVFHQSKDARASLKAEVRRYAEQHRATVSDRIYRKHPELAPDGYFEQVEEERREADPDVIDVQAEPIDPAAQEMPDDDPADFPGDQTAPEGKGEAYEGDLEPATTTTRGRRR